MAASFVAAPFILIDHQKDIDRFTSLPTEILSLIFDHLYYHLDKDSYLPPICRSLLSFHRHYRYYQVQITFHQVLRAFIRTLVSPNGALVGSFIKFLRIHMGYEWAPRAKASDGPSGRDFVTGLATMQNLASLELNGGKASYLARAVLLGRTHGSLQKMKFLSLCGCLESWTPPFDYYPFANLSRYPLLQDLTILYPREMVHTSGQIGLFCDAPNTTLKTLTIMGLEGLDNTNTATVAHFFGQFKVLDSLTIFARDGINALGLATLSRSLSHLDLHYSDVDRKHEGTSAVDSILPRLSQLRSLELGSASFTPSIYTTLLSCTSIRQLTFHSFTNISWNGIKILLEGPNRMPQLERLVVDVDPGRIAKPFSDRRACKYSDSVSCYDECWEEPDWTDDFSFKDAKALRDLKKTSLVEFEGTFLEAIDVQIAYDTELERVNIQRRISSRAPVHFL